MMGRHPLGALRRIDRRAMHRAGPGAARPPRRQARPRAARSAACRSPTSRSSRSPRRCRFDARVLIMDEPTAALSGPEVERLFGVVRTLRERGAAVLFISHRLEEVFAICDTVTVHARRRGRARRADRASMTTDELVRRMVGRELGALFPKQDAEIGEPVLQVDAAHARGRVHRRQLRGPRAARSSRSPGLVGAGPQRGRARDLRHRPRRRRPRRGRRPRRCQPAAPLAAMRAGIGFVPEDRRQQGLVMDLSIARNAALTRLRALRAARPDPRRRREPRSPRDWATRLQLKFHRLERPGRLPVRRQPAEGRARQVARHRARSC